MKKKIFLVGMPASGKSNLGKLLADELEMKFLDLDKRIMEKTGCTIEEIFADKGEDEFRKIEKKALNKVIEKKKPLVLATGGGAPCFFDNMERMNRDGITIYLEVKIDLLFEKLLKKGTEKRPLLKGLSEDQLFNELKSKYESRRIFYEQSNITIEQNFVDPQQTVNLIISKLKPLEK